MDRTTASSSGSVTATLRSGTNERSGVSEYLNFVNTSSSMFGQQSGNTGSDLLLGSNSGFDPSPSRGGEGVVIGNGYGTNVNGNESGSVNNSSAFDLSDFPSLGGAGSAAVVAGGSSNGFAAILRQQQLLAAQQQMMQQGAVSGNGGKATSNLYRLAMSSTAGGGGTGASAGANFNMTTEDFPALPGAPAPGGTGSTLQGVDGTQQQRDGSLPTSVGTSYGLPSSTLQGTAQSRSSSHGGSNGSSSQLGTGSSLYSGDLEGNLVTNSSLGVQHGVGPNPNSNLLGDNATSVGNLTLGGLTSNAPSGSLNQHNPHQQRTPTSSTTTSGTAVGSALTGDYGLLGLLGVIRMSDADRNALALGSDLTSLGLNLNSSNHLYSTFASPWSESPTTREPQYQLPMCYYMQPPALKTGHLSKFQLETLFYIFYALPKDVLQAYAAQELYAREWRYHVDLKLWFKRASPADGVPSVNSGVQYIYFDINSWERRLFNGSMHQNITSGLLPEEDVRVKFPNS